jgi:UDP-GlcNAc:undecaprenyl-phosphate GlcNAc-1-phosphate transferase
MSYFKVYIFSITAFIVSFVLQYLIRKMCYRFELFDHPGERKVHCEPVPRIGGLGIYIAFSLSFFLSGMWQEKELLIIFAGASALFLFNLADDLMKDGIRNKIKLIFQILVISMIFLSGIKVTAFLNNPLILWAITVIWMTGITNSFNLIDNMNGLSSGLAMIAAFFFAMFFSTQGQYELVYLCIIMIFSVGGFFMWNFPKGRVFMGDCGANFIGFLLASIAVLGSYVQNTRLTRLPIIAPIIILSVPIYDTVSVMIIRKIKGFSIFRPDKNHISHRLTYTGLSNVKSVLVIFLIAIISGISALLLQDLFVNSALLLLLMLFFFYILITILVYAGKKD